jgi:hypothetical protein
MHICHIEISTVMALSPQFQIMYYYGMSVFSQSVNYMLNISPNKGKG